MTDVVIAQKKRPTPSMLKQGKITFGALVEEAQTNPFAMVLIKALTSCPPSILQRLIRPSTSVVVRSQKKRPYAMALTISFKLIA